jgi:hypothetical protein
MQLEVVQLLVGAAPATGVLLIVLRWAIKYQVTVTEAYKRDFTQTHQELVESRLQVEEIRGELHQLTSLYQKLIVWLRSENYDIPEHFDPFVNGGYGRRGDDKIDVGDLRKLEE